MVRVINRSAILKKLRFTFISKAIAYTANPQDKIKIPHQYNTLEIRRNQGILEDFQTYQSQIEQELQRLQEKLNSKQKQKV